MGQERRSAQFLAVLQAYGAERGGRLLLSAVWHAYREAFPDMRQHPQARRELYELLHELSVGGQLRAPKNGRSYESVSFPPLPQWIELLQNNSPLLQGGWHAKLAFVSELSHLAPDEREALPTLQSFLSTLPVDAPQLTTRERSLLLFGDEKRLERLAAGPLFGPGRLTFADLACYDVYAPLVYTEFAHGSVALVVENKDTFHSALVAARTLGASNLRWIIYGGGHAIVQAIGSLTTWPTPPSRIFYFGDVDVRGLYVANKLQAALHSLASLPSLECPSALYSCLIERAQSLRINLPGSECTHDEAATLLDWLPSSLRSPVYKLLVEGGRWPQEAVTAADMCGLLAKLP